VLLAIAGVFFISCFYGLGLGAFTRFQNKGGEFTLAKVNGEEVPRDLYERTAAMTMRQYEQLAALQKTRVDFTMQHQARGRAFESVVESFLKSQAAEREGIQVSRGDVRKAIDQRIKDEMGGGKLEGATPQEKAQFEAQLRQLMPEDLQRKQMLIEALDKKLRERFKPTEADVIASYNEAKIRHILVKTIDKKLSDADAKKKADALYARVKAGEDFAKLAKENSDDPGSKENGGDLGWINSESPMVPEFKTAALSLKKGEISPVVKSIYGYHILKADDTRSKLPKDFSDPKKKEEYRAQVEEKLLKERLDTYYQALKVNAKIEAYDPFIKGYMAENEATGAAQQGDTKTYEMKIKEAAADYELAAAKNQLESGPALYAKLAQLYNAAKLDDKALAAVNRALDYSRSAELLVTKGEIYERKKNTAEAIKAYQQAMEVSYDQPWQYTQLQMKFKALKRDDLAKQAYAKWQAFVKADDARRARDAQASNAK
jgi:parvulin-like peptidyl-prolyl isomerase